MLPALDRNHFKPPIRERLTGPAGSHYERLVDVCEELVRFTWLVRDNAAELVDRYSERMEKAGKEATAARSIAEARTG